jgi:hypothetical protein
VVHGEFSVQYRTDQNRGRQRAHHRAGQTVPEHRHPGHRDGGAGTLRAEGRNAANTTPTTLEEFARSAFAPAYRALPKAGLGSRLSGLALRSYLATAGHR